MELVIKHFNELTTRELYDILKFRVSVFVVEQNCPYQEIDELDLDAYHMYLSDNSNIIAYLRVFKYNEYKNKYLSSSETVFNTAAIGRVAVSIRRKGYATQLLKHAIDLVKAKFDVSCIILEAQVYASKLYEQVGFTKCSEEFLEDGIPHIQMILNC